MRTKPQEAPVSLFSAAAGPGAKKTRIYFEDRPLDVPEGISVASALLISGVRAFRSTPVSGAPRAPYCMMGVCFECLVEIDGRPGRQSCLTPVRDGMVIKRQEGASELKHPGRED
ncbi:NAD(FAD)-dependent dehydrogenase [Bordetella genomosp. 10]|uniref:NAD(FAD)-dependent dehydrogenase n=1 Tax=Bordetella genomosp. 10 TaxID=1416804 RepID=A0A261S4K8_9BORD|nr:(2Fe-2S)-binding protein [Bordetella genomosp. 10]OZI32091.1 NAD(FAD)-dependent dehydrogenase [Bordetella genomosp. 10]